MPFTFSHPAYILPAKCFPSKYISVTGLVFGSLIPDFEYFFRMDVVSYYSHSIAGIFFFDLPIVFLISLLFHQVIKKSLILNSSHYISSRFVDLVQSDFLKYLKKNKIVFILSALIGITSHLFIDAFTHMSGYFVREFSTLNTPCSFFGLNIPWYRLLQHITSVIGLLIIFLFIYKLPESKGVQKSKNASVLQYWILIVALFGLLLLLRFYFGTKSIRIGYWAINFISCGMISLTVVSIFWKIFRKV